MDNLQNIVVRKAHLNDVEEIVNIHVTAWKEAYKDYVKPEILNLPYFSVSQERIEKMKDPVQRGLVYVIEDNQKIMGFLSLLEEPKNETEIKVFYVLPNNQRKGFGSQLFRYVWKELEKQNCEIISLWTMKDYPVSNSFYQKHGGQLTGEEMRLKIEVDTVKYVFHLNEKQNERD